MAPRSRLGAKEVSSANHGCTHSNGMFYGNSDGTFLFHEYDKIDGGSPPERNKYAKGTWKADKKIIAFFADTSDFDEKHTLNFNTTKARFISKSPRDTSDKDIKTSIQFFQSEIPWITGRTFIKAD